MMNWRHGTHWFTTEINMHKIIAKLADGFNSAIEHVLEDLVLRGVFLGDIRIKKIDGVCMIEVLGRPHAEVWIEFKDNIYSVVTERMPMRPKDD